MIILTKMSWLLFCVSLLSPIFVYLNTKCHWLFERSHTRFNVLSKSHVMWPNLYGFSYISLRFLRHNSICTTRWSVFKCQLWAACYISMYRTSSFFLGKSLKKSGEAGFYGVLITFSAALHLALKGDNTNVAPTLGKIHQHMLHLLLMG